MPFAKRFEEISKKIKPVSPALLWLKTALFSVAVFAVGALYLYVRRGTFDLSISNKVFASTAVILIGLSFALSAICYFWNFADTKIIYRKYLGLSGFAFAV